MSVSDPFKVWRGGRCSQSFNGIPNVAADTVGIARDNKVEENLIKIDPEILEFYKSQPALAKFITPDGYMVVSETKQGFDTYDEQETAKAALAHYNVVQLKNKDVAYEFVDSVISSAASSSVIHVNFFAKPKYPCSSIDPKPELFFAAVHLGLRPYAVPICCILDPTDEQRGKPNVLLHPEDVDEPCACFWVESGELCALKAKTKDIGSACTPVAEVTDKCVGVYKDVTGGYYKAKLIKVNPKRLELYKSDPDLAHLISPDGYMRFLESEGFDSYDEQCVKCAETALAHYNLVQLRNKGVAYEFVRSEVSTGATTHVVHVNFFAKPKYPCSSIDPKPELFFAAVHVDRRPYGVSICCILDPTDEEREKPNTLLHPEDVDEPCNCFRLIYGKLTALKVKTKDIGSVCRNPMVKDKYVGLDKVDVITSHFKEKLVKIDPKQLQLYNSHPADDGYMLYPGTEGYDPSEEQCVESAKTALANYNMVQLHNKGVAYEFVRCVKSTAADSHIIHVNFFAKPKYPCCEVDSKPELFFAAVDVDLRPHGVFVCRILDPTEEQLENSDMILHPEDAEESCACFRLRNGKLNALKVKTTE